ncbi:MAG: transglycosylase SLT domain-containing protein [Myxococcota bacterium]
MARTRIALLALVSAALLSGGAGDLPGPREQAAPAAITAADVARVLERVNPDLSPGEVRRVAAAVIRYGGKYDLDPELVTAVLLVESAGRPWARSHMGAVGLMQVMPHVAKPLEMAGNLTTIESNIEAGCLLLADNIRRLGERDGISAYFWGSQIRNAAYLDRVRKARATVRRLRSS